MNIQWPFKCTVTEIGIFKLENVIGITIAIPHRASPPRPCSMWHCIALTISWLKVISPTAYFLNHERWTSLLVATEIGTEVVGTSPDESFQNSIYTYYLHLLLNSASVGGVTNSLALFCSRSVKSLCFKSENSWTMSYACLFRASVGAASIPMPRDIAL